MLYRVHLAIISGNGHRNSEEKNNPLQINLSLLWLYDGHDHMVVGFTTTCAISAYHH
jgi:hypothetical protein